MSSSTVPNVISGAEITDLFEELRAVKKLEGLPEDELRWVASRMTVRSFEVGEVFFRDGEPVNDLIVCLSGYFVARPEKGIDDGRRYFVHAGEVTGKLPYSRMKNASSTARAAEPSRIALFPGSLFPELQKEAPEFYARLVNIMTDRARDTTRDAQQLEKMAALGKLSAGLAHELNNPAAAARRAAESLKECVKSLSDANLRIDERGFTVEQRVFLTRLEKDWQCDRRPVLTNSLERADLEDELGNWLSDHGVSNAWDLAPGLADASCDVKTLNELAQRFEADALGDVIERLSAASTIARLAGEIESATSRMSQLVRAIKEYSYMDQMPQQDIDIHEGIENTLVMLGGRLKNGITVHREYDRTLPKIPAFGSELNQVWTNLIDNASDAMNGTGEIWIRTVREVNHVLIEVRDNGPGIPDNIKPRIFEPFFTTKGVGKGTGLGLDTVFRIVRKHNGEITAESKPGDTRFHVRLPLASSSKGETK